MLEACRTTAARRELICPWRLGEHMLLAADPGLGHCEQTVWLQTTRKSFLDVIVIAMCSRQRIATLEQTRSAPQ
jgi:hypothetical protein